MALTLVHMMRIAIISSIGTCFELGMILSLRIEELLVLHSRFQWRLIRNRMQLSAIEIDTVDGFQGREKEAIILTLVRSNPEGEIGFLADTRRTNVALTRAKRALRVIGDSATLANNTFYRQMLDYFEFHNAYHSVWELGES